MALKNFFFSCLEVIVVFFQVILYKLSGGTLASGDKEQPAEQIKKWVYVGYVRAHTHDVRALTVATPICGEGLSRIQILFFKAALSNNHVYFLLNYPCILIDPLAILLVAATP